jgi:2-oxoglutarate dehydrogenase E2 component (dihydrolipoamide succinyltransferase)
MIDIKVPSVGESVTEGRLARWLKPDGATVQRDEMVVELETDKATAEVPAPAAGVLRHRVKEGETVAIGTVIGSIDPAGAPKVTPKPAPAPAAADGANARRPPEPPERKVPVLMPAARRAAEEAGVDPSKVTGTGKGGRILKEDVLASQAKSDGEPGALATGGSRLCTDGFLRSLTLPVRLRCRSRAQTHTDEAARGPRRPHSCVCTRSTCRSRPA